MERCTLARRVSFSTYATPDEAQAPDRLGRPAYLISHPVLTPTVRGFQKLGMNSELEAAATAGRGAGSLPPGNRESPARAASEVTRRLYELMFGYDNRGFVVGP
jgi:hypothetical protein